MYRGRVITSGGHDLVETLEEKGYEWVKQQYGIEEEADEQPATSS
jgi:Fe-S cluster assembly ATP-binding protein